MDLKSLSEINLWFKLNSSGSDYNLMDIPELIPYRWDFFKNNWDSFRETLLDSNSELINKDLLQEQIKKMDSFVLTRRSSVKNPFDNQKIIGDFSEIFSLTLINSLTLNPIELEILRSKIDRVSKFNKQNFLDLRKSAESDFLNLFDSIGLTDETTNDLYNRSPLPKQLPPQISSISSAQDYLGVIKSLTFLIANFFKEEKGAVDQFAIVRNALNNPTIPVSSYSSMYLALMEEGSTLQDIAQAYLGNSSRFLEIAVANNLKPPYIDEIGETISIISNAREDKINLPPNFGSGFSTKERLYRNQLILIQSNTLKSSESRRIVDIQEIPVSGEIIVKLDGKPDLDKYTVTDGATIRFFKPNTTNSNFFIFIPTNSGDTTVPLHETPWFMKGLSKSEQSAGVDLKINEYGDLIFDSSGDLALSYGMGNAVQAIKIKLNTERGENANPNFGMTPVSGGSMADIESIRQNVADQISNQIAADNRFIGLERLSIALLPPAANQPRTILTTFSVRMAGGSGAAIPISFTSYLK